MRVPTRLCSESLPYGAVDHCVSTVSRGVRESVVKEREESGVRLSIMKTASRNNRRGASSKEGPLYSSLE